MKRFALTVILLTMPVFANAHGNHDPTPAVDVSSLSRILFTCVNEAQEANAYYLAMSVEGLTVRDNDFDLVAYPIEFTEPTPVNDRISEKNRFDEDQYRINTALTMTIRNCDRTRSSFRTVTTSRGYKLDSYITQLPFHNQCQADETYETCSDQRIRYQEAWEHADSQGKKLLIVYGYEGCVWCDSIWSYLGGAPEINEQYLVLDIGDTSINRTGRAVVDMLFETSGEPENWGLPLLISVNPVNDDVQTYDIEAHEINEYNDDVYSYSYVWVNHILGIETTCDSLLSSRDDTFARDQQALSSIRDNMDMEARQQFATQLYLNSQHLTALDTLLQEKGCR